MLVLKKTIRGLATTIASFTIVASPLAQGVEADHRREAIMQSYLKNTGLASKTPPTVGEFYSQYRGFYPPPLRGYLDRWVLRNKDEIMPHVDVQQVEDAEGRTQYRLLMTANDGKTVTLMTGEDFIKLGAIKMEANTLRDPLKFARSLATDDPYLKKIADKSEDVQPSSISLSYSEFSRLGPAQRATYFLQLRRAIQDAEKIMNAAKSDQKATTMNSFDGGLEIIARWMLGEPAFAKTPKQTSKKGAASGGVVQTGGACIVAGYKSTYGEGRSCGGKESGLKDFTGQISQQFGSGGIFSKAQACASGSYPCNPIVYGFEGNKPYCISSKPEVLKTATAQCNEKSPLAASGKQRDKDRERIIQSWLAAQGDNTKLKFKNGKIDPEQYEKMKAQVDGLGEFINTAVAFCDSPDGQKLQKARHGDQDLACSAIKVRALDLQAYAVAPPPPPVPPAPICGDEFPGSELVGTTCVCHEPKKEKSEGGRRLCAEEPMPLPPIVRAPSPPPLIEPMEELPPPLKPVEECGWFCRNGKTLLIGGLLLGGIAAFAWWVTKDNSKTVATPQYVPPVPPPLTTPTPTPAPVVPVAPVAPVTEGGTGIAPINSGGVRGNR